MKATFKNFTISTGKRTFKPSSWDKRNTNSYTVTVRNTETGSRTSFDFWCSIARPTFCTEYDVLNAFYCFVSDAGCGADSFTDFCRNLGYDSDSITALKTWKACKRSLAKFLRVSGFSDDELYDFANELQEIAG